MSLGKKKMLSQGAAGGVVATDNFNTVLYTGNGGTQAVTGVGFQPDFVWFKVRNTANEHVLFDSVRGVGERIHTNTTDSQASTLPNGLTTFGSDGFTVVDNSGGGTGVNGNFNYVSWNWYAPTSESISASGSRIASTVKKNVDAGFSIVQGSFATNEASTKVVGHGLTSPKLIIYKATNIVLPWFIFGEHGGSVFGNNNVLRFNTDAAANDSSFDITGTTFKVGSTGTAHTFIAYCFENVAGYQKIGSYAGNGTTQTIDVGFTPRFVMIKAFTNSSTHTSWAMFDNQRLVSYDDTNPLYANLSAAEGARGNGSGDGDLLEIIFVANTGFKLGDASRNNGSDELNDGSNNYLYLAIA